MKKFAVIFVSVMVFSGCATRKPIEGIEQLNQPVVASYAGSQVPFDGQVQVIAWNIERGLFWQDCDKYLAEKISEKPATIMLIGEVDRMHSRSGDVFVADEMARSLQMNMVFVTEFIEYNDKTKDTQGDHGNAILSPFPLSDISVIRHTDLYSWTRWGWLQGQPRKGERVAIGATAALPDGKRVRVYVVHFESSATSSARVKQMQEVLDDAKKFNLPAVIGGDFNELPGGFVFRTARDAGFENSFEGNHQPTGTCSARNGRLLCSTKIDWQVNKGLTVTEKTIDYPLNSSSAAISDHAPVRVIYKIAQP